MAFQPKTEPGSLPRSIPTANKKECGEMSISELVSVLRIAYKIEDFDKIEEELVKRESKLRAEIGSLREKIELERLKRIEVEERPKISEVQFEKGKRAQENYEQLLKEVKTGGLVEKHAIEELGKKNVALEREVCELKEFRKIMVDEMKSVAELRDTIRVLKEEKIGDKNTLDVLIMKNVELEEAVKKNLTVIEGLRNENGKLTDEKHELKTLFESMERRYSKLRVRDVKLEESTMPLMSEDASDCGNTEVEHNPGISFAVKDEKDISDQELENDTGELVPLQRDEDTHYSVDNGTAQSPKKVDKEDAVCAIGVKFKLEKEIVDLSDDDDDDDDDDKYTSQGEKVISQIIEENEHPQRVEMIKRKRVSDIQASISTSTSSADLFEKENLPVKRYIDMTRIRETFIHYGESFTHVEASKQQEPRCRPASDRRRGRDRHGEVGPSSAPAYIHEEQKNVIEQQEVVPKQDDHDLRGFSGGPEDTSLLTGYVDHVACAIWDGQDRVDMKLVSHGKKIKRFGMCHEHVEPFVINSGLMPLCHICYEYPDKGLILAFVERWHRETNTFHLPFGEMTVTLDDVFVLLHLPIVGQFCPNEALDFDAALESVTDLLGVERTRALSELKQCRGPHVRLSWLRHLYTEYCENQQWEFAARAYLLHLVGCTIFVDKSATYISVSYLHMFTDLQSCGRFAWGAAALAHLYEQLGDASYAHTRQLAGYLTLLQSWIYEHFPGLGRKQLLELYDEQRPRATRFLTPRYGCTLHEVRAQVDALTYDGVVWNPYASHRVTRPFITISLFSGFIRVGEIAHRHLPERVLRQFGFQQPIPRSPLVVPDADLPTIDARWLRFTDHVLVSVTPSLSPNACVDGYLQWFRRVSHPYVIQGAQDDRPSLVPRLRKHLPDDLPLQRRSDSSTLSSVIRRMMSILQSMIACRDVSEGTVAWDRMNEVLEIGRQASKEYACNSKGGCNV